MIDQAAKKLSELKNENNAEKPFIHLTFLDAFTPENEDREGAGSYGSLPNYPNHYSEHYVDRTPSLFDFQQTNAILPNAFNFDLTNWHGAGLSWLVDKANLEKGGFFGHWWPVTWYINSITAPEFKNQLYGFPLSLEGGDSLHIDELAQTYRPGEKCSLTAIGISCLQLSNE